VGCFLSRRRFQRFIAKRFLPLRNGEFSFPTRGTVALKIRAVKTKPYSNSLSGERCSILLILFALTLGHLNAAPFSPTIPLPSRIEGTCADSGSRLKYHVFYDSAWGGHWDLTGVTRSLKGNQVRESFSGTISDATINGTFTEADFEWLSDSYQICYYEEENKIALQFKITIRNGTVVGTASYPP
jgi:hypothetical protein